MAVYIIRTFNAPEVPEPSVEVSIKINDDDWLPVWTDQNGVYKQEDPREVPWRAKVIDDRFVEEEDNLGGPGTIDFIVVPV